MFALRSFDMLSRTTTDAIAIFTLAIALHLCLGVLVVNNPGSPAATAVIFYLPSEGLERIMWMKGL